MEAFFFMNSNVDTECMFTTLTRIDIYGSSAALLSGRTPKKLFFYNTYWASEARPTLGCSIEISRDIYPFVCLRMPKCVGRITWPKHAHAQSQFGVVKTDLRHPRYSFSLYARAALAWTKKKRSLRNEKLKANRLKNRCKKG